MSKRKCEDIPCVLGLPAQTAANMRIRRRRKAETVKKEIITTGPTREDNTVVGQLHQGDSSKTLSGGCPKDVDEKVLIPGQGSLIHCVGNVGVEKVIDDSALPDENEGSVVVNNATEKVIEGCFSKHTGSVTNSEEIIQQAERADQNDVSSEAGESRILPEEKSLHDECEKITPEQPLGTLVSDSSRNSRNDISQGDGDMLSSGRSLVSSSRKKLLVLDLNGLIADIIRYIPERHTPDKVIAMKAVFKRPFYEDFLQFCFARFNVGVWSSRAKSNVHSVVDFLLGDAKQNLLFCWDQSHCTQTGFYTVENRQKPLLAKKLKKLWEKYEPDLPWKLGEYNETNTLMLDDSPYKALFNPPHTAVFPPTYTYTNKDDNSLGPGGALRLYLEGLAGAEDVQEFVKKHPFGQRPITERNASWRFYQKVLETGLITPEKVHRKCAVEEPEGRQEITDGQVDLDSSKKTLESCTEPPEQKASDSPSRQVLLDTDRPDQKSGEERRKEHEQEMQIGKPDGNQLGIKSSNGDFDSGNKALDLPVEFCERGANGSPSRTILHDSDRPRQKRREVESEQGIQRGEPDRWQHGIQCGRGDIDPTKNTLDLLAESIEEKASGSPTWDMLRDSGSPHERRGFKRKEEGDQKNCGWQGRQSGKGDLGSAYKPLHSRPKSSERRASGSPRRLMLHNTDRLQQRRGFARREESEQQELLHGEPVGGQAIQSVKQAFDCANKKKDSRAESREQRSMFCDTNRPQRRGWGVEGRGEHEPRIQSGKGDLEYADKNMDLRAKSRERRASGSPRRNTLRDTDQPHWKRGVERREGQRASNFIRFDDADYANRQDYGMKTQRWEVDWNQSYRDTNKHPVSEDPMAGGDSYEYSSYDIRSSGWSIDRASVGGRGRGSDWSRERGSDWGSGRGSEWSNRGRGSEWSNMGRGSEWCNRGRGSEWNNRGRGSEWNNRGRGSEWNNRGRGSDWNNRGRGSEWNNRGRGLDWNNRASQELEKWPVPYDQKGSHHSGGFTSYYTQRSAEKSRAILGAGGRGDWKQRPYQPIDQRPVSLDNRMSGFSYNNRYSTPSFHWQAYR